MHLVARGIVLSFLVFLALAASAESLTGKVGRVVDGDTLYILDTNYKEHKDPEFVTNVTASSDKRGPNSNRNTARVITG